MLPGRIDCYGQREVAASDRHAKWNPVNFGIYLLSHLHFTGTGCRSERRQGFIGDLVRDHTCAPPFEVRGC